MRLTSILILTLMISGCSRKLAEPTNLAAVALTDSTIKLSWVGHSTGEEGFRIYESVDSSKFSVTTRSPQDSRQITLEKRKPGTTYRYMIAAFAGKKLGKLTEPVTVTTPQNIPKAPTNLSGKAIGSTIIKLAWDDNSISEFGFIVERKNNITGEWEEISRLPANWQEYDDSFRMTNTAYTYRVRSWNPTAASDYSNECTVTTADVKKVLIVSPNGGELFRHNAMLIKWEADPEVIWVRLSIHNDEGYKKTINKGMLAFGNLEAVGFGNHEVTGYGLSGMTLLEWGKGEYIFEEVGSLPPSKTYKVRVTDLKSGRWDESDGYFEVE